MNLMKKNRTDLDRLKHILELSQKIQKYVAINHLNAIKPLLEEIVKEVININENFGNYISKISFQKEINSELKEIMRETDIFCCKMDAAIKMGRDDIALTFLQQLTSILSPYFGEHFSHPSKKTIKSILPDTEDYIN